MTDTAFLAELTRIAGPENVLADEPMSKHTTFRVGGPADYFITPDSESILRELIHFFRENGQPYFICGNGSNLLVPDDGYRGAVVRIGKPLGEVKVDGTVITAGAGALLSQIAQIALQNSLAGFEFAGGIPGTLGGACVMNAGAYGGEMKHVLVDVSVLDENNDFVTFKNEQLPSSELQKESSEHLELGYRTSVFTHRPLIALSARIQLEDGDPAEITAKSEDFRKRRLDKQPLDLPSAGSTFKRPEGHFAGKLIMDAGLRGYRVGGASVSTKHCGFVVNDGGATAADILQLIEDVEACVFEQFGVRLEPEVKFLR